MKRPNWENAKFGASSIEELEEADLSWLCGCGLTVPYADSKAYPICECGLRMRILHHAKLGYVTTGAPA